MSTDMIADRARRANGLPPRPRDDGAHWATRVLRSPWTWLLLVATCTYAASLLWMYATTTAPTLTDSGTVPGLNWAAIRRSAGLAFPTLAAWIVVFLWVDRFRPARLALWYLALGWGASIATAASMVVNTWAGQHLAIAGDGDPASGARTAVFVAPFVEEATKATVLFWIAIALRHRVASRLQAVTLAGLSAAAFAFTENILYYSRAIVYASRTIETGDPEQALAQIVLLRGVFTAFGHPLFTAFTAFGVIVALRSRSKVVRVIAPLCGYLVASLAHMVFNFLATAGVNSAFLAMAGWLATLGVAIWLIRSIVGEGRRHRDRLTDYVRMGWLPEADVRTFSRQLSRWWAVLTSLTHGGRVFVATVAMQRTLTELVYLRDSQIRGLVDAAGHARERELLERAHALRAVAIVDTRTQKMNLPHLPPSWRWRRRPKAAAPAASVTAAGPQYSPVDPRWGPPKG